MSWRPFGSLRITKDSDSGHGISYCPGFMIMDGRLSSSRTAPLKWRKNCDASTLILLLTVVAVVKTGHLCHCRILTMAHCLFYTSR